MSQILKIIIKINHIPNNLPKTIFYWQNEKRKVKYKYFFNLKNNIFYTPKKIQLISFYQDNYDNFIIPEKKNITYTTFKNIKKKNEIKKIIIIDKLINEGVNLNLILKQFNLKIKKIKNIPKSKNLNNNLVNITFKNFKFITSILKTQYNKNSKVTLSANKTLYFITKIDTISPQNFKSLKIDKKRIITNWKKNYLIQLNKKLTMKIKNIINKGYIQIHNKDHIYRIIYRNKISNIFNKKFIKEIFKMKIGQTKTKNILVRNTPFYILYSLEKIIPTKKKLWGEEKKIILKNF